MRKRLRLDQYGKSHKNKNTKIEVHNKTVPAAYVSVVEERARLRQAKFVMRPPLVLTMLLLNVVALPVLVMVLTQPTHRQT